MKGVGRILRFALPMVLLLTSLILYLAAVRPMAGENHVRLDALSKETDSRFASLEMKGVYPTEATLAFQEDQVETMREAVVLRLGSSPTLEDLDGDLESIFRDWAYRKDDPLYLTVEHFHEQAVRIMGPQEEQKALLLTKILAYSSCHAGLEEIEKLECYAGEAAPGQEGDLGSFEVDVAINAGATEGMRFLEEWILLTGGSILIEPMLIRFKRLESGHWAGDLRAYSSPPVRIELRLRVIYTIGKG